VEVEEEPGEHCPASHRSSTQFTTFPPFNLNCWNKRCLSPKLSESTSFLVEAPILLKCPCKHPYSALPSFTITSTAPHTVSTHHRSFCSPGDPLSIHLSVIFVKPGSTPSTPSKPSNKSSTSYLHNWPLSGQPTPFVPSIFIV